MRPLLDRFKSRKFWMALAAAGAGFVRVYYPDFPDQAMYTVAAACLGYVAIEGAVDAAGQLAKWAAGKKVGAAGE
jgi:hypothetical protein